MTIQVFPVSFPPIPTCSHCALFITDTEAQKIVSSDEKDLVVGDLLHASCWKEISDERMPVTCPRCGLTYQIPASVRVHTVVAQEDYSVWPIDPHTSLIDDLGPPLHRCNNGVRT